MTGGLIALYRRTEYGADWPTQYRIRHRSIGNDRKEKKKLPVWIEGTKSRSDRSGLRYAKPTPTQIVTLTGSHTAAAAV